MGGADPIAVIEAAYRIDVSETEWLAGIAEAARPLFRGGLGAAAYTYDASDIEDMRMLNAAVCGMPPMMTRETLARIVAGADPQYVLDTWRSRACGLASETPNIERQAPWLAMRAAGIADVIAVNGTDASGFGCWVGTVVDKPTRLSRRQLETFERLAAHCAAGLRVRRALAAARRMAAADPTKSAEAVLDPGGGVKHATGEAEPARVREILRDAAIAIDRARGGLRRREPERAVGDWKGLVSARWTLLDHFESDGRRYVLARRNEPGGSPLDQLTARERQVLGYLALGHSQKLIAYELGISPSTVGALVWRAARKLGVSSRDELRRIAASAGSAPRK